MVNEAFNIFFPQTCAACDQVLPTRANVVCADCLHNLPLIEPPEFTEGLIKNQFYGRVPVDHAASLMAFHKKGLSQHLIHRLKYKGDERISAFLGEWLAAKLSEFEWPKTIDVVIPVPLHKNRKRKRGFNQVEGFGRALAKHFDLLYCDDVLIKISDTRTQVYKNRLARTELKGSYFTLKHSEKIRDKHIWLVDDIVTTGATLETCAQSLLKAKPSKISLATMAVTI